MTKYFSALSGRLAGAALAVFAGSIASEVTAQLARYELGKRFIELARFAHQIGSAVCSEGGSARWATEASGAGAIAPVSTLTEIAKRSIATGDRPT